MDAFPEIRFIFVKICAVQRLLVFLLEFCAWLVVWLVCEEVMVRRFLLLKDKLCRI